MALIDKILGRETRAHLEHKAKAANRYAEMNFQLNEKLRAALDIVISEGHFRNNDGRLLGKGKLPAHLREKLGLD